MSFFSGLQASPHNDTARVCDKRRPSRLPSTYLPRRTHRATSHGSWPRGAVCRTLQPMLGTLFTAGGGESEQGLEHTWSNIRDGADSQVEPTGSRLICDAPFGGIYKSCKVVDGGYYHYYLNFIVNWIVCVINVLAFSLSQHSDWTNCNVVPIRSQVNVKEHIIYN